MPDVAGISDFNYYPRAEDATKDTKAREASSEDAEATPVVKDSNPTVDP